MNLPFFKTKKQAAKKMYLGLLLKEDQGIAMVMKHEGEGLVCIDQERFSYSNAWENLTQDIDEVLFRLENRAKIHFKETIIYLYSHLIDPRTKEIRKEYLSKIKEVSKNLELTPLGYIETYETVARFIEKREQLSLTSILAEVDKSHLGIFIYKGGKIVFTKSVARTDRLADDFSASLEELKGNMLLPARIILYNSTDLDDEAASILTHRWSEDLFIQLPRVEVIKESDTIKGLVMVFHEQLHETFQKDNTGEGVPVKTSKEVLGFVIGTDVEPRDMGKKVSPIALITSFFTKVSFPRMPNASKLLLPLGIVLIGIGFFLNEYFFHKASLTVYLPSHRVEKSFVIESEVEITAATVSSRLTDSKATTGKKEIGERAKGEVTLHNFSASARTFKAGTTLEYNAIVFVLDQDTSVASASNVLIGGGLVKQPGKSKVDITAKEIGPQGNLDKGKQFSIDGLPQDLYLGINDSPFSKGSKKEIRTVSRKDIDDLKATIMEKAKSQNDQEESTNESMGKGLLKKLSEQSITQLQVNREIGEESDQVSVTATVSTTRYSYNKDVLINYLKARMSQDMPPGFTIPRERVSYEFEKTEKRSNKIILEVKAKAIGVKETSAENIKGKITLKQEKDLGKILIDSFEIKAHKIVVRQPLPFFQHAVPLFKKNIDITFSVL